MKNQLTLENETLISDITIETAGLVLFMCCLFATGLLVL
jgi:hypothetical protein